MSEQVQAGLRSTANCVPNCQLKLSGELPAPTGTSEPSPAVATWLDGGAALVDAEGRILQVNDALALWLGAPPGELPGRRLPELLGQRHAQWKSALEDFLAGTAPFDRLELVAPDAGPLERLKFEGCCHGTLRFVRLESALPPAQDLENLFPEACWGRLAVQNAFQRLLRAEAQLDNLNRRWPGIIFSQRPDFSFAFISPRIEELTGVPASEWRRNSKYFWQVVHEADAEALLAKLRGGSRSEADMTSTYRIRHVATGRVSYLWEHRQPVQSSNGLLLGYEGIWLDITRQTIAERRLLTMSWKENLGTLTLGLAHDFCNIMTGIVALSETYGAELEAHSSLRTGLDLIRSTANEAGQLARRIRQLHQGSPGEINYHDLNEVVANMAEVLQKVLPRRVRVASQLTEGQCPVYVDAVELRQVIVNLALNAAEAMPDGGPLTFRTSRHEAAPAAPNLQGTLPRLPLVCLSVQDSGMGIAPRFLTSIFDPFFTTKPLGKGSGLGLYNARLFAERHGAAVSVESAEQIGTTFQLWFAQSDFTEAEQSPQAKQPVRHTLLVVGPAGNPLTQAVTRLRENGYYVATATSATEALETLHAPYFQFTGLLLVCANGYRESESLFGRLRAEKLPLKTFCLVGCNQDEVATSLLEGVDAVLPFDMSAPDLFSRLKTILDKP